ncbi:MAG: tripartite tricarboxylate transporter TctB family protein [Sphaerochaeta sp.]|nr:tripartite tricarboxylate transporter TctB family protein [Sphaerochaeta sp.]
MEMKQKDFNISLVLVGLGLYSTIEGIRMYRKAARPPYNIEQFSISPGFLPTILGALLLILSITLFVKSIKGCGFRSQVSALLSWSKQAIHDTDIRLMVIGMLIMGIYAYFLIGLLPYWLSSVLFLTALMAFLRATKLWKIILISTLSVALVIVLFQVVFNVSLP